MLFKDSRKKYFFIFFLLIFILFAIETLFFFKFKEEFGKLGCSLKDITKGGFQDSPYSVYESVPNRVDLEAKYRLNNYGFRNENDIKPKEDDEIRIFILGSSAALGYASANQFRRITGAYEYPSKFTIAGFLEQKLSLAYPNNKIKVFNAAVSGFTVNLEYNLYMGTIRGLNPDLIILIDGYNDAFFPFKVPLFYRGDLDRKSYLRYEYKKPMFRMTMFFCSKSYTIFYLTSYFIPKFSYNKDFFEKCLRMNIEVDRKKITEISKQYSKNICRAIDDTIARYKFFKQACLIDGIHILYCPQPILTLKTNKTNTEKACYNYLISLKSTAEEQIPFFDLYELYLNKFEDWAEKADVSYINLQKEINKTNKQIFVDYCHFSRYGNDYIADLLNNKIIEMDIINTGTN